MVTSLNSATPGRDFGYNAEQTMRKTIGFGDVSPIVIAGLPVNGVVTGVLYVVGTAFNAGSTATIAVGYTDATASNASAYSPATSVATIGVTQVAASGTGGLPLSRPTSVIATVATTGSAATAGSADIIVRFVA